MEIEKNILWKKKKAMVKWRSWLIFFLRLNFGNKSVHSIECGDIDGDGAVDVIFGQSEGTGVIQFI